MGAFSGDGLVARTRGNGRKFIGKDFRGEFVLPLALEAMLVGREVRAKNEGLWMEVGGGGEDPDLVATVYSFSGSRMRIEESKSPASLEKVLSSSSTTSSSSSSSSSSDSSTRSLFRPPPELTTEPATEWGYRSLSSLSRERLASLARAGETSGSPAGDCRTGVEESLRDCIGGTSSTSI